MEISYREQALLELYRMGLNEMEIEECMTAADPMVRAEELLARKSRFSKHESDWH